MLWARLILRGTAHGPQVWRSGKPAVSADRDSTAQLDGHVASTGALALRATRDSQTPLLKFMSARASPPNTPPKGHFHRRRALTTAFAAGPQHMLKESVT